MPTCPSRATSTASARPPTSAAPWRPRSTSTAGCSASPWPTRWSRSPSSTCRAEAEPMRALVLTENITLDGVIDASEGWFDVTDNPQVDQSDPQAALREQSEAADAVLFGRVAFEERRA